MAKDTKKAAAPAAEKPAFKYGVKELEEATGMTAFTIRTKLRNNEVPKNGSQYGWNNKTEFDGVVKLLKTTKERATPEPKAKAEAKPKADAKKPAKTGKAKPATLKKKPKAKPTEPANEPKAEAQQEAAA